ncbi:hypothetical protein GCM10029964_060540 [Kibdelosporangium lantanae]
MLDPKTREMYVELLGNELGESLTFSRYADPRHDVYSLIYACFDYRDGIKSLVEVVRQFHQDSLPMRDLETLVEGLLLEDFPQYEKPDKSLKLDRIGLISQKIREPCGCSDSAHSSKPKE